VWSPQHTWITTRHLGLVERYCRLRDVVALTFQQLGEDGVLVAGSTGQTRSSTLLPQLKNLSTELRLCETELGLTPAAESKTAAPTSPSTPAPRPAKADRPVDTSLVTLLSDHRKRDGA
jgi:P27 family predicted phage terminase small subunit